MQPLARYKEREPKRARGNVCGRTAVRRRTPADAIELACELVAELKEITHAEFMVEETKRISCETDVIRISMQLFLDSQEPALSKSMKAAVDDAKRPTGCLAEVLDRMEREAHPISGKCYGTAYAFDQGAAVEKANACFRAEYGPRSLSLVSFGVGTFLTGDEMRKQEMLLSRLGYA